MDFRYCRALPVQGIFELILPLTLDYFMFNRQNNYWRNNISINLLKFFNIDVLRSFLIKRATALSVFGLISYEKFDVHKTFIFDF